MPPYYSEINFTLTRSVNCVVSFNNTTKQAATFVINNTKLYVLAVTLPTQEKKELLRPENQGLNAQLFGINIDQKY